VEQLELSELRPLDEVFPGVVLSSFSYAGKEYHIFSKSGGFGKADILRELRDYVKGS